MTMRNSGARGVLVVAAAVFAATAAQAELKYRIVDLGTLQGGNESLDAFAINNAGAIIGQSINSDRNTRVASFIWENGSLRGLAPYGQWATYYNAYDINDSGVAVGSLRDQKARTTTPVMYRDGKIVDLSVEPGKGYSGVTASVNNSGMAVGHFNRRAFIYDGHSSQYIPIGHPTQFVNAYAINDNGVVMGAALGGKNAYNFLWDGEKLTKLDQYSNLAGLTPVDFNNSNTIVGRVYGSRPDFETRSQGFIYQDGKYIPLGSLGATGEELQPSAINDKGWVVGISLDPKSTGNYDLNAFLWRNGTATHLNDLVVPDASGASWDLRYARDINERGQIVGFGFLNGGTSARAFLATPVPEGDTWALMLAGLGVVGWRLRCRS